jgi:hypothetical protein
VSELDDGSYRTLGGAGVFVGLKLPGKSLSTVTASAARLVSSFSSKQESIARKVWHRLHILNDLDVRVYASQYLQVFDLQQFLLSQWGEGRVLSTRIVSLLAPPVHGSLKG